MSLSHRGKNVFKCKPQFGKLAEMVLRELGVKAVGPLCIFSCGTNGVNPCCRRKSFVSALSLPCTLSYCSVSDVMGGAGHRYSSHCSRHSMSSSTRPKACTGGGGCSHGDSWTSLVEGYWWVRQRLVAPCISLSCAAGSLCSSLAVVSTR